MAREATVTGGREATTRQIDGDYALCVGTPIQPAPSGWKWHRLADIARLESGHTPSRHHPEYWGGDIHWISLRDAKVHHGSIINTTAETTNPIGIANSSARVLPAGTVCLSRTASVGYVVVMARPMATSQDFVNWTCSAELEPRFLQYLFIAERAALRRFSAGAVHPTIYYPEVKAFHVCLPPVAEQKRILEILDTTFAGIDQLITITAKNLGNAQDLFQRYLDNSFDGLRSGTPRIMLEDVLSVQPRNGWSPPAENHSASGTPVLTLSSVTGFHFRPDKVKYSSAATEPQAHYWVHKGDLLMSRSNTPNLVGQVAIVSEFGAPTIYPDLIMRMRSEPSKALTEFLYYQLRTTRLRKEIVARAKGANPTMVKISKTDVQTLQLRLPSLAEQKALVKNIDLMSGQCERVASLARRKLSALNDLKASILNVAFSGELAHRLRFIPPAVAVKAQTTSAEFGAKVLLLAHHRHVEMRKEKTFGRVKAQKLLHLVESIGGFDLGRMPIKDAAGPNDSAHQRRIESWAKENKLFEFVKRGAGYEFRKLQKYEAHKRSVLDELEPHRERLGKVIDLLLPMNSQEAELIATVHAAWSNLLLDGSEPSDETIVKSAREEWHPAKLKIPRAKFVDALRKIKRLKLVPDGSAKRVCGQERLL